MRVTNSRESMTAKNATAAFTSPPHPPERTVPGVVEVFAGIGCVARGFGEGGRFRTLLLNDIDPAARKAYQLHAGEHVPYFDRDIRRLRSDTLARNIGKQSVAGLLGCPPCQGFSDAGQRLVSDPRNRLVGSYFRLIDQLRPRFFVMENVEGLLQYKVFKDLAAEVGKRYRIWSGVLNAALYGVPQTRRRAIVIGYRKDLAVTPTMPRPTHLGIGEVFDYGSQSYVSPASKEGMVALGIFDPHVDWSEELPAYLLERGAALANLVRLEEAIGDLPEALKTDQALAYAADGAAYAATLRAQGVFDHAPWNHRPETIKRLQSIPEGGVLHGDGERGRSRKYFSQAYARLHRHGLARTITTNFHNAGSGRFLHYGHVRTLTVREAARLQGIPDSFRFKMEPSIAERLIGNAFPQPMAKVIAAHVAAELATASG
jgi:DNA (cytosine-5)-methyltransferase 1